MSINNPDLDYLGNDDDEFEELYGTTDYEYSRMESTEALLPTHCREKISESSIQRDIEQVQELLVEEVRWFYRSGKKKKWRSFNGCDSINIELEWRRISNSENEIERVCVRGGMYEVDVIERKCYPVYWSSFNLTGVEDSCEIMRGMWFYDGSFVPLDEELATRIEGEHMERWKGFDMEDIKELIKNTVMHSVKLKTCHIDWYTVNDVYLHSDAVSYRALRNIVQKFGGSKTSTSGSKLKRGYSENAMYEDCTPSVEHLVFVVHGIGAKPDRHKIVRNTDTLRMACERVAAKQFTHYTGRVEFLPVEWRSKLKLDDGLVETITPKKGQGMRQFLNNNLMDVLYYSSPLYRAEIVEELRSEINRLHKMFLQRNRDFRGKISVFAHSLGSVIMHDIMTGWTPHTYVEEYLKKRSSSSDNNSMNIMPAVQLNSLEQLKQLKLKPSNYQTNGLGFQVENFFCVGSPLAVFLSLRGYHPGFGQGSQEDIISSKVCHRIFNIFHPADPVAYRFEPLILSHYSSIAPLTIHWHNALNKTPYNEMSTRPYEINLSKEMTAIGGESTTSDGASGEVSDCEDSIQEDEVDGEQEGEVQDINENEIKSKNSPQLKRRSSYLKSVAGSAFRVSRGWLTRAKESSTSNAMQQQMETSVDGKELKEENPVVKKQLSQSSSRSSSPSTPKKLPKSESPKKQQNVDCPQTDTTFYLGSVQLENRIDYELQEGFTESRLGYASFTSHTSYWGNNDVALFILMQIHPPASMVQSMHS